MGRHSEWEATTIPGLKAKEQTVFLDLSESWGGVGWIAPRELLGEGRDPCEKQGIGKRQKWKHLSVATFQSPASASQVLT